MVAGPAAAARTAETRGESVLDTRLRWLLTRADRLEENRLAARLLPPPGSAQPARAPEKGFYWLQVAEWLADSFGLGDSERGRDLFEDLCWIQYCVYGLFRVQDDLVDGETAEPLLAVEANQLSAEAARRAARWFDGASPFWDLFQGSIDRTSRAIVALHDLQRRPDREPHVELALYVDLAACLQIAAGGVAIASGRERDWTAAISPALDHLAVAGQILDDLEDVDDDLGEGRINYAAWCLTRPVFGSSPEALQAVVAFNLATSDRLEEVIEVARGRLVEAAACLGPSICPAVHRYFGIYRRGIDALEKRVSSRREALFAPARAAA